MQHCTWVICLRVLGMANEVRWNALLSDGDLLRYILVVDGHLEMRTVAPRWWNGLRTYGGDFFLQHQLGGR